MPSPIPSVKAIFDQAHELSSAAERQAFLDQACNGLPELRREVEALLHAYDAAGSFLETPAGTAPVGTAPVGTAPVGTAIVGTAPVGSAPAGTAPATASYGPGPEQSTVPTRPTAAGRAVEGLGSQIGPYRLVRVLGQGGMGEVFLAEQDRPIRRQVALKIIRLGLDSEHVLARFDAERQALTLMTHAHIARVYDANTTPLGRPYFVMELVQGLPLTQFCDEQRLTIRARLKLFTSICQAVQHAHQKGVMHRDLKPSNVLVTLQDGQPTPKIIDFGLAKAVEQPLTAEPNLTQTGTILGTLRYMSPEQANLSEEGVDTRTDIYSLGVMLFELLTGSTPLDAATLRGVAYLEAARRIREQEAPRPSVRAAAPSAQRASIAAARHTEPARLVKELRGELDWITLKAMEKDRERRYETASALARDIERYLDDEPVEACPPSTLYRLGKFARKHRGALISVSVILMLLMLGVAGLTWGLFEVNDAWRAQRDASQQAQRAQLKAEQERLARAAEGAFRIATVAELRGRLTDAETAYRSAIVLYTNAVAKYPHEAEYRNELARVYFDQAHFLLKQGKRPEAAKAFAEAVSWHKDVVDQFPDEPAYQRELADAYNDLGAVQRGDREYTKAEVNLSDAIYFGEKAMAGDAANAHYRVSLAASYHNLGNVTRDRGKPEVALTWYGKAIATLAAVHPRSAEATEYLRNAHWDRANALDQLGRPADAVPDWQRASDLDDGGARAHLRWFQAASRMEQQLEANGKASAKLLYNAAVLNGHAAQAAQAASEPTLEVRYSQRALALLRQADAAGWFRDAARLKQAEQDPAFRALPEFRRWLQSVRHH